MLRVTALLLLLSAAVVPASGQPDARVVAYDVRGTGPPDTRGVDPSPVEAPATTAPAADSLYEVVYDTGIVATFEEEGQTYYDAWPFNADADLRFANRFTPSEGSYLASVAVATYYRSDFEDFDPASEERNFRLHLWADSSGVPGAERFALDVTDDRRNEGANLVFLDIDLSPYRDAIGPLPDTLYVGLSDQGTDDNLLVMPVTAYEGDNVSYLYLANFSSGPGWALFDAVVVEGERPLEYRVAPIRATFAVPDPSAVADEDARVSPPDVALRGAYPNPFNPSTSVAYQLGRAAAVRLHVYDVLGRRVAGYDQGMQPAGAHAVYIDAGAWPSGLYHYVLEAAGHRLDGRLVLVK